jgi:hypothetical protein
VVSAAAASAGRRVTMLGAPRGAFFTPYPKYRTLNLEPLTLNIKRAAIVKPYRIPFIRKPKLSTAKPYPLTCNL